MTARLFAALGTAACTCAALCDATAYALRSFDRALADHNVHRYAEYITREAVREAGQ